MKDTTRSHAAAAALGALGILGGMPVNFGPSRRRCAICKEPIMAGDGFRQPPGIGYVHTKCIQEKDKK